MEYKSVDLDRYMSAGIDFLSIIISKEEVEAKNLSTCLPLLRGLLTNKRVAEYFKEKVEISFSGYDTHRHELWEIAEVRNYVNTLDSEFPYWAFFLSKRTTGLHCIIQCFHLPFLTQDARKLQHPLRIAQLLEQRWLPALNQINDFAGVSDSEKIELTRKLMDYLENGPKLD